MNKVVTLIKAPILTQSGYGIHSRLVFESLINDPSFEVLAESLNWGDCSFVTYENEQIKKIKQCVEKYNFLKSQNKLPEFDLFVHVTIPNEFERRGKVNIGVTAAVETDRISVNWIQKCQEMDLIIVPSEHSKKVITQTPAMVRNEQTGETGQFYVQKPVIVCPEGVDTSLFKKMTQEEFSKVSNISDIKFDSDFNFLHVGQWGHGGYGEDRKNIANLIKYFIETFLDRKDVGLVLKVNMARNTEADYSVVSERIKQIKRNYPQEKVPPIYLLHASFTEEEMAALYNHPQIKAFVSFTAGEGMGLPLLEAAACELPVIATNWSGHLDFLEKGKFSAVSYEMKEIPKSVVWEPILTAGSQWAAVYEEDAKARLKKMASSYSKPKEWAAELAKNIKQKFDTKVVCKKFNEVVKQNLLNVLSDKISPVEHLESLLDTPDDYNVLFTMPRSTGDVFVSTAVLDGLRKILPENSKIYFATQPQYFDILKNNPNVHKVVPYSDFMIVPEFGEQVFDLVLTPDVATQYNFSNFVRKGQGRLLAEEYAAYCQCELGEYFIEKNYGVPQLADFEHEYITFHPGSGKGQWASRRYDDWQEVLDNLKDLYPDLKIVQVGSADEPQYKNIDLDLRGKTDVHQLAAVITESNMHLSIDTFTMHLAASQDVPVVAIFGCSHAQSTGPWIKDKEKAKFVLIESTRETGCKKRACYKPVCVANPENPPINEIDSITIVESCAKLLEGSFKKKQDFKYKRTYGKISGYTTTYNAMEYPFVESIKSMLSFADEVVVVDAMSTDGTYEVLQKMAQENDKLKIYQNEFDWSECGMDGLQKTMARSLCDGNSEFLWQQDSDEIVHEDDYEKIKMLTKKFPKNVDILHLPIVELWGSDGEVTGRRSAWKWRLTRNKPEITHGINASARLTNETTGKVYAKEGMSDGCEYVDTATYQMLPHVGFWNNNFELARVHMPEQYAEGMNKVFERFPSVYHYSWFDLPRKINQLKKGGVWDKMWGLLYQKESMERFPGVETDEQVKELARKLYADGGESTDQVKYKFKLNRSQPKVMSEWITKHKG